VTGDTSQIPEVSDLVAANQTGTVQSAYLQHTNKTNRAVKTKAFRGSRAIYPLILNLSTRWR
jgi:hypothetical protein